MTKPYLMTGNEMQAAGISIRTNNQQEMNPATARIGALWQQFFAEGISARIPHQAASGEILAVYTDYESDHTGNYTFAVTQPVTSLADLSAELYAVTIPASRYLVFRAAGPMPMALINTWLEIWQYFAEPGEHQRAYTCDFERHNPAEPDVVDIFVAVR